MKPTLTLCLFTLLFVNNLLAQKLPTTNVYLFDISQQADSTFQFTNPTYLTAFNSEGYNNQPHFMSEEELYLTVQMADDTSQTDIYALNFKTGVKTQVTATPESEYSPTFHLNRMAMTADFTCVRVATDENGSQRLWRFPINRSDNGEALFKDISGIGYHAWISSDAAALFIVGAPHRLIIANNKNGRTQNIGADIGRCLARSTRSDIYYVRKLTPDSWFIRAIDSRTRKTRSVTEALPGVEDFAIMDDGSILMAKDSKLYRWTMKDRYKWSEIADFGGYGIGNITRLAVREGKLALVNKAN